MNRKKLYLLVSAMMVAMVAAWAMLSSVGMAKINSDSKLKTKLKKPDIVDIEFVAYNNWNYVMRNQGSYFYDSPDADENGNNAGGEFPRGSGITIVYAGGLYVGTLKSGVPVVSETEFATEFQPGRITNSDVPFAQLTAENSADQSQQVYLIDRSGSGDDWNNWPADAPKDQFGGPGIIADAQTWAVFNDLDTELSQEGVSISPDPGLGLQIILESFAFNAGPLSDVVYCKFTIVNKTNVDYDDSYLGMWMDADVDQDHSTNDIVGVDTARGLGFVYNADNTDNIDGAVGFDFLQGPVVKTADVSATLATKFATNKTVLVYNVAQKRYLPTTLPADEIWLGATSFNTYANGTDPRDNSQRYNLLAGRFANGTPKSGQGASDYYAFRGNPITQQGSPDVATSANQADQRILHGVGPFTIKAGSSQEIWVGIVGSQGTDRLNGVANMFATDDLAQETFEAGLVAPAPPDVPTIKVVAYDGQVSITWLNNSEYTEDLAGDILGINTANNYSDDYVAHDFQGYRVYKSRTGLTGSYTMLAQYDLADGLTHVQNKFINQAGVLEVQDVVFGDDTGLRYSYIDHDVINGQRYYYAVTAYDAQPYIAKTDVTFNDPEFGAINNPSGLPISLETSPTSNVVSAVPMGAVSQTRFDASVPDEATHSAGVSDGYIELVVVDPEEVTGDNYRVEFYILPDSANNRPIVGIPSGELGYRVVNTTTGQLARFSNKIDDPESFIDFNNNGDFDTGDQIYDDGYFSTTQAIPDDDLSDEEFGIVDGIMVRVFGPPLLGVSATYENGPQYTTAGVAAGQRWFSGVNFGIELVGGGVGLGYGFLGTTIDPADLKSVDIKFSRTAWQTAYGHTGAFGAQNEFFPVPFRAYDVDAEDGDPTPIQLNVMVRDGSGFNANAWCLDNILGGDGTGPQQRNYTHVVLSPYDSTAGSLTGESVDGVETIWSLALTPRTVAAPAPADGFDWNDSLKAMRLAGSDGGTTLTAAERSRLYAAIPDEGTLHLVAPNILLPGDQYTFSTTANSQITAKSELKKSLKNVLIVPNPYLGRSSYQASLFDKVIKFTNLPATCTIKIFTVSGDLVATLNHNSGSDNDRANTNPLSQTSVATARETSVERWDLRNPGGKYVASGMYVALVEAPGIGKRTLKFAVIQEEIQINGPDNR